MWRRLSVAFSKTKHGLARGRSPLAEGETPVTDFIRTSIEPPFWIDELVVFPKPEFFHHVAARRHVKSVALLRLDDGTAWMLVRQGEPWCSESLWTAAGCLAQMSAQAFTRSSIEHRLREKVDEADLYMLGAVPDSLKKERAE